LAEAGRVAAAAYPADRYLDRLLAAYAFAAESAGAATVGKGKDRS